MKEYLKNNWIIFIVILIIFGLGYNIYNESRRNKLLKKSIIIKGFLVNEDHSSHKFLSGDFEFRVNNKKYNFRHNGDFSFLKVGDTVLIEYAIEDPTVARVKDRYYMKKFNYMKKKTSTNPR
jgi:hypothetical protein